jgi:hypothetical protein
MKIGISRLCWSTSLALAACGPSPTNQAPNEREETIDLVSAWAQGEAALMESLERLPDTDRWLALQVLMEAHPEASTTALCEWVPLLSRPSCESRKAKIQERPHLWGKARVNMPKTAPNAGEAQQPRPSKVKRTNSGPATSFVVTPKNLAFPFSNLKAEPTRCAPQDSQCRQQFALTALRRNDLNGTAALCLNPSELWQSECFFRMGEEQSTRTTKNLKRGTLADAMRLCFGAKQFIPECIEQSVIQYSLGAPSADDPNPAAWANSLHHARAFGDSDLEIPLEFREEILERYWSALLLVAFQNSEEIMGNPLDHLPEETSRHIRAAAAYQSVGLRIESETEWGSNEKDLRRWGQLLLTQLETRSLQAEPKERVQKEDLQDFWREDAVGDEDMPATIYLGASRRTFSPNPLIDAQICWLEALAQHKAGQALLQASTQHENAQIAWTASRLIRSESNRRRHKPNAP